MELIIIMSLLVAVSLLLVVLSRSRREKYTWNVTEGSTEECSKVCGGGYAYGSVVCTDGSGNIVPDDKCSTPKPDGKAECNTQSCTWSVGDWGSCSKPCGGGYQTRTVSCTSGNNNDCPLPVPVSLQDCNNQSC